MLDKWIGHLPVTNETLLAVFARAVEGDTVLSRSERALVTACDVWAAAGNGELARRFRTVAADSLLEASEAFRIVGASYAADDFQRAAGECSSTTDPRVRRVCLEGLEHRLIFSEDNIDSMLAAYARGVLHRLRTFQTLRPAATQHEFLAC